MHCLTLSQPMTTMPRHRRRGKDMERLETVSPSNSALDAEPIVHRDGDLLL
jgi:hypothetical protein